MRCKKVQKLILSDYIDGELNERLKKKVDKHLSACTECRKLYETVRMTTTNTLKQAGNVQPPEEVWQNIKGKIEQPEKESPIDIFIDRVHSLLIIRKPAFAVITAVMMIILVVGIFMRVSVNRRAALNSYLEEQVSFLNYLGNGNGTDYFYMDIGLPGENSFR